MLPGCLADWQPTRLTAQKASKPAAKGRNCVLAFIQNGKWFVSVGLRWSLFAWPVASYQQSVIRVTSPAQSGEIVQVLSGSYAFIAPAIFAVCGPRSF